jgi:hypothetical protein
MPAGKGAVAPDLAGLACHADYQIVTQGMIGFAAR